MTTQEMIDYLTAQVKKCPELADRQVVSWNELENEFTDQTARQVWFFKDGRFISHTPHEGYETRIEIQ